jgi:hypothetical protein
MRQMSIGLTGGSQWVSRSKTCSKRPQNGNKAVGDVPDPQILCRRVVCFKRDLPLRRRAVNIIACAETSTNPPRGLQLHTHDVSFTIPTAEAQFLFLSRWSSIVVSVLVFSVRMSLMMSSNLALPSTPLLTPTSRVPSGPSLRHPARQGKE